MSAFAFSKIEAKVTKRKCNEWILYTFSGSTPLKFDANVCVDGKGEWTLTSIGVHTDVQAHL